MNERIAEKMDPSRLTMSADFAFILGRLLGPPAGPIGGPWPGRQLRMRLDEMAHLAFLTPDERRHLLSLVPPCPNHAGAPCV
jgi:hypothetical protein